jgi:hypothetical protein
MSGNVKDVGLAFPNRPSTHEGVFGLMSKLTLWFNRDSSSPVREPDALTPYTDGTRYLSTKQVPSCLILRHAGSMSVTKNRDNLLRGGFTLTENTRGDDVSRDLTVRRTLEGLLSQSGSLAEILMESARTLDILAESADMEDVGSASSGSENDDVPSVLEEKTERSWIRFRKDSRYRIKYDDPWKIHAGRILGDLKGKAPQTLLWSGDGIRLQDPLPPRLFGKWWNGNPKSKVRFTDLADKMCKLHVLYEHTHWGKRLRELCNEDKGLYTSWARTLRNRINRFLGGSTDPTWSRSQVEAVMSDTSTNIRARSQRFIELLKTVDGIFLQRYLSYPEEVWTWERFDMFTLGNLSFLIGDEFLDGEMTELGLTVVTSYSQLKAARKWFKSATMKGKFELTQGEIEESVPHWCRQFVNVWARTDYAEGARRAFLIGILSQTRGCGTPPPLVVLQSKVKFLKTISTARPPEDPTMRSLRRRALEKVINDLPQEAFTGLATKARVTVTTAASWEKTRKEGGTIEAAREILESLPIGEDVPVRDLHTGEVKYRGYSSFDSTGEVLFWLCLDHVLRTPPDLLRQAFLTVVKEPGKARSVTKARVCLKIVLDLVNKLCSRPLERGIRSSASGMGRANHGWNLFCRMMSDDLRDMVFALDSREENPYEGYVERTDTFKDLFVSSTDYEEATDRLMHSVSSDLGGAWMRKCGIPPLLQAIVQKTCFMPRKIFFYASGVLENIGTAEPAYGIKVRSVEMVTGVLMGDPLTKVVLHLVNVVAREVGAGLFDPTFYDTFDNATAAYQAFMHGVRTGPS